MKIGYFFGMVKFEVMQSTSKTAPTKIVRKAGNFLPNSIVSKSCDLYFSKKLHFSVFNGKSLLNKQ